MKIISILALSIGGLLHGSSSAQAPADSSAYRNGQRWIDRPSSSTEPVSFSIAANPYHSPPTNTDCCKPMALPEFKDERRQILYRVPRNYISWMDDWNGGPQKLIRLKMTFPGFQPLTRESAQCLSLSPAFRPTTCSPIEFTLRAGGAYDPPDDVRFNNRRSLFHSQEPLPGPFGFELYQTGPAEARIDTYRKMTPQHLLVIDCFSPSKDDSGMTVCQSVSRLESGNVLSYFLYRDQLKDAEEIDIGIRKRVVSFTSRVRQVGQDSVTRRRPCAYVVDRP